jgi:hypothetical protein
MRSWFVFLLVPFAADCATLTPLPVPRNAVPALHVTGVQRVVLIILENGNPTTAAAQSFMQDRAATGMIFSNYFAVAHPSQPNYVAMISGSTTGALTDNPISLHRAHLGQALGTRWRVYADDYPATPGHCNLVKQHGDYVRRHVPFLSFADVQTGTCAQIVRLNSASDPVASLRADIAHHALPGFAMIVPNLTHDGHRPATIKDANKWLNDDITPLLTDPAFTTGTVFILTFDEDDTSHATHNRVFTVLWGDHVKHGTTPDVYDHEDLLATIAALLDVTPPPLDEPGVRAFGGIWQ